MNKLLDWMLFLLLLAVFATPFLWAYAVVDACGWKGFFVECRIMGNK